MIMGTNPPGSKAPDRPDFHRREGFARRFARKGGKIGGSSTPDGTTPTSFSPGAYGQARGGGRRIYPPPSGKRRPPSEKRGPPPDLPDFSPARVPLTASNRAFFAP